jgi:phosphonate transport system substrate-binding protein
VDQRLLEDTSKTLQSYLESHTPYKYKIAIPPSFVAVVEAFGSGRADVASINTYGYVLAHEKYGVQARLVMIRFGAKVYQAQFLARSDSGIHTLRDFQGKKIAFVDPSSVSGYLMPLKYLQDHGIKPKETVFAMRHDNVVSMIYQRQVDGGVTFYSPPAEGQIQDARRLVRAQYPDVEKKVKIIQLSSDIPNDPIVFRKDMPEPMKKTLIDAFIAFSKTPEGLKALKAISSVTGFERVNDSFYDDTRAAIQSLGAK